MPNPKTSTNLISFKSLVTEYKKDLIGLLILVVMVSGLSLAIPFLSGGIIKSIEINQPNWSQIWQIAIVTGLLFVVEMIQIVFGARFREQVGFDLRQILMKKLVTQNYTQLNKLGVGESLTLFGSDVNGIKDIMAGELVNSIKAILLFIGALVILLISKWELGLIAFVSMPVIILSFGWVFKSVMKYFKLSQENQTNLNSTISQNIYGSNLIRVQNAQGWEIAKFGHYIKLGQEISFKIIDAFSVLIPIINVIANWTTFGILYFGAVLFLAGQIKIGDISAYISYYGILIAPVFIIGFNSQGIARLGVSIKRINKLLEAPEEPPTGSYQAPITQGYKLINVNLEISGKKLLDNINIEIKLGQKTAILGPTGAGKSLLINILTGMIEPTSGQVLLDNQPISNWDQAHIKQFVATVFQESLIFGSNIRQNIILNKPFDKVKYDLTLATSTLDTLALTKSDVSELGANLSGGQKQRLTLARALYNNPQILFLDDFTARVDKDTENLIYKRLATNYPQTTIINVTQNISSIQDYDQIILIMEGEQLAIGTHKKLLHTSPEYKHIHQSQQTV